MKKGHNSAAEKGCEARTQRKSQRKIQFNLSPCNLACFQRTDNAAKSKGKPTEPPK